MVYVRQIICPVLTLLCLILSISSKAQKDHVFKIGVNKIFNKQYFIAYEGRVYRSFSINLELGYLQRAYYLETIDQKIGLGEIYTTETRRSESFRLRTNVESGYQVNLEGRFRPGEKLNEGLYLGLKSGYQKVDFGILTVQRFDLIFDTPTLNKVIPAEQHTWTIGGTVGFNFKLFKKSSIDINVFTGYMYTELIDPTIPELIPYSDPTVTEFQNNHRNPVDQVKVELNIYLCF